MKVWQEYGTEHSMNLKLIGHFADSQGARAALDAIKIFIAAAEAERAAGGLEYGDPPRSFSEPILAAMSEVEIHSLGYADLEQFLYGAELEVDGADVVVRTDEIDVIAFVKVLLLKGGKVEMYSMHDHSTGLLGR